jgi:predicted RNA-binding protein with PIN domain
VAVHLIIDGYNLIRQSARWAPLDRRDLQSGREALIDALSAYRKLRPHRITVVFDAAAAPGFEPRRDRRGGVEIRFSAHGQSADALIRRMAAAAGAQALVVSSDRAVVDAAAAWGATVIDSPTFENRLEQALAMNEAADPGPEAAGWMPTTRKKGPRRRLPKRQRRASARLRKL